MYELLLEQNSWYRLLLSHLLLILNISYVTLKKKKVQMDSLKQIKVALMHEYITKLFILILFVLWKHSERKRIITLAVVQTDYKISLKI